MAKLFTAVYLDGNRRECERDFFLPDERSVRAAIKALGGNTLAIREQKPSWLKREFISKGYKIRFLDAVKFHTEVGMSPEQALKIFIEGETHSRKRMEFEPALEVIRGGGTFTDAIEHISVFDRVSIAMLRAGERAAFIKESIKLVVEHLENKQKLWTTLIGGVGLMSADIVSAIASLFVIQYRFIPWLVQRGISTNDTAATARFEEGIHRLSLVNGAAIWATLFICTLAGILTVIFFSKQSCFRDTVERFTAKMPLVRSVVYDGAIGNSFAIIGRMLKSNVPLDVAASTAQDAGVAPAVKQLWADACQKVLYGLSVAAAMDSCLIRKSEKLVVDAHQNSRQLGDVFLKISEERNYRYQRGMKALVGITFLMTVAYSAFVVLIALKAVMLQNEGLSETFKNIGSGAF